MSEPVNIEINFPDPIIASIEATVPDPIISNIELSDLLFIASGGTGHSAQEDFTATAGQTHFTLAHAAVTGSVFVAINGLLQPESEWSASGNAFDFNNGSGIAAGDIISIFYLY